MSALMQQTRRRAARTVGRYRGFPIQRSPLRDVLPTAELNPWLWFAFEPDRSDLVVCGVLTRRNLEAALDSLLEGRA